VAQKLQEGFAVQTVSKHNEPMASSAAALARQKETAATVVTLPLEGIDPTHPYLKDRGIKEETAQYFGCGYFAGRGVFHNRIVFPLHNDSGELVGYAGRSIDNAEPRYLFPAGLKKSALLFNFHRVKKAAKEVASIIIVEGFFDCMKVHQAGFRETVALMGSSISDEQVRQVVCNFSHADLMLDADEAGWKGTTECLIELGHNIYVTYQCLPDWAMQPDELTEQELRCMLTGGAAEGEIRPRACRHCNTESRIRVLVQ
jgi:DNA primase